GEVARDRDWHGTATTRPASAWNTAKNRCRACRTTLRRDAGIVVITMPLRRQVGGGTPLFGFSESSFDPSQKSEVFATPIKVDINSTDADAVVCTERGSTSGFGKTGH